MWVSDRWQDFEVIDASDGERLERWGNYILIRPDPQVIWKTDRTDARWQHAHAKYHRSRKGGGEWELNGLPDTWAVRYDGLTFRLKPFSFKHTGLFPEQAVNWDFLSARIRLALEKEPERKIKVLNLFAYTGGATLAAAKAGAYVTHVDASRGMVTWAHENASASSLHEAPIRYLVDDCIKFVNREIRRGNAYDGIIMDPPSYGRGPKGEIWKLEDMIDSLLALTVQILSDRPLFFILNSYTTGLQSGVLSYLLSEALSGRSARIEADELGLPVTDSGLVLPCGACGRAVFDEKQEK